MNNNIYTGPNPKNINSTFPDHSYELIVCLVNGEQKRKIEKGYLLQLGWSKEKYLEEFPNAPTISHKSREQYKKAWNEKRRQKQSNLLTSLNYQKRFQEKRIIGYREFMKTPEYEILKKEISERTKKQHQETNLEDQVRLYFQERFKGSKDQQQRTNRLLDPNHKAHSKEARIKSALTFISNGKQNKHYYKHKKYKDTKLTYQSSLEKKFLDYCFKQGLTTKGLKNGEYLHQKEFKRSDFYISDYILFNNYCVEVKCNYIEQLQEQRKPNSLAIKKQLAEEAGYIWLYVKDEDYTELDNIILNQYK